MGAGERSDLPEIRKDPLSNRVVIIAPQREGRPDVFQEERVCKTLAGEGHFNPFLEGHENATPGELFAIRNPDSKTNSPGWQVRVVPNGFPALLSQGESLRSANDSVPPKSSDSMTDFLYQSSPGIGSHEVIIECPHYEDDLAQLPSEQFRKVLSAYQERIRALRIEGECKHVLIFKNKGRAAGASLGHSHSQLIAMPILPQGIEQELDHCEQFYQLNNRELFDVLLEKEESFTKRIVTKNEFFSVFCAYAGRFPYETWIVPRRSGPHFEHANSEELDACAELLRSVLHRFHAVLGETDYNFILHTAPFGDSRSERYRWHFELFPRSTGVAGFEWGTGCFVNSVYPEQAAKELRDARQ